MSTGVSTPLLRYIGAIIGLYTQRGFRTAYSTLRVFSGPQLADRQEQKSAFFCLEVFPYIYIDKGRGR